MKNPLVGVIGGMGPLASAAFLNTIYQENIKQFEQESPRLLLSSDPSVPDRTTSIVNGTGQQLVQHILTYWNHMRLMEIDHLIIPCMTFHFYLQQLPREVRSKLISLVNVISQTLDQTQDTFLLLATQGTYQSQLIQHERLVLPSPSDMERIHQIVYTTLKHSNTDRAHMQLVLEEICGFLEKYQVNGWVCGCTEYHLLTSYLRQLQLEPNYVYLDPLLEIAKNWYSLSTYHSREGVNV